MFYRIRQLFKALFPRIRPQELSWAHSLLSDSAWRLFQKQSQPEQRHALDVAQELSGLSGRFTPQQTRTLLVAALLHDCGKSRVHVKLRHRILAVLLSPWPVFLKERFASHSPTTALALDIHKEHARWGRDLAAQAGLSEAILTLILEHHDPKEALGKLLKQADSRH